MIEHYQSQIDHFLCCLTLKHLINHFLFYLILIHLMVIFNVYFFLLLGLCDWQNFAWWDKNRLSMPFRLERFILDAQKFRFWTSHLEFHIFLQFFQLKFCLYCFWFFWSGKEKLNRGVSQYHHIHNNCDN